LFSLCNDTFIIFKENIEDYYIKKNISLSNIENEVIFDIRIGNFYDDILLLEDKNIMVVKQYNSSNILFYLRIYIIYYCKIIILYKKYIQYLRNQYYIFK